MNWIVFIKMFIAYLIIKSKLISTIYKHLTSFFAI